MNIKLEELNLAQLTSIEKCVYNSDFVFTDEQFRDFVDQQIEFGLDPVELELQEEIVYIYDEIYFFENLISQGEHIGR